MIVRKKYLQQIRPFINKPIIKVITGIRRCGKSSFLKLIGQSLIDSGIKPENILTISKDSLQFDFIENYKQLANYVIDYFKPIEGKKYLFIDEVQEIEGWEKALSGFLTDQTADLFITGSNSRMLSSDLATYIAGRYIEIKMNTLSFSEFLSFRNCDDPSKNEAEFGLFLKYGGFPGIHRMEFDDEVIAQYVAAVANTIMLKDVVSRNHLRDYLLLERIARFTADNCGNITTSKKIADFLKSQHVKCSVDTVQSYLGMLCAAFIFYKVNRYDIKGKRLLEISEKYYMADIGLKHSLLGYRFNDISGHLENVVYLELLYRGYTIEIGKFNELEIDFVAKRKSEVLYVQVAYLLTENKTIEREFGAMEKINDNYPKIVLSLDKYFDADRNGIKWKNLIDFLVSADSE